MVNLLLIVVIKYERLCFILQYCFSIWKKFSFLKIKLIKYFYTKIVILFCHTIFYNVTPLTVSVFLFIKLYTFVFKHSILAVQELQKKTSSSHENIHFNNDCNNYTSISVIRSHIYHVHFVGGLVFTQKRYLMVQSFTRIFCLRSSPPPSNKKILFSPNEILFITSNKLNKV